MTSVSSLPGLGAVLSGLPGTAVPGFHIAPLRGWVWRLRMQPLLTGEFVFEPLFMTVSSAKVWAFIG